ncbi:hypothetical protein KAW18_01510 [candidate division WOR-3 bacterium]|nr:hypothetical protein [candidate division WOR-3 bacterium]
MVRGQKATTTNALVESLVYFSDHAGLATAKELRLNCPSVAKIRGTIPSGVKVMRILVHRGWVAGKVKTTKKNSEKTVREPIKRRGSVLYKLTKEGLNTIRVLRGGDQDKITHLLMGVKE